MSAPLKPILDLGALDGGPVLLFGGPYGNLQATEALFAEASRRGIPKERRICTGDVVAYCADAQGCVDLVRQETAATVMGNCEESVGFERDDCGCGFEEGTACDILAKSWYDHAKASVDTSGKAWMRGLPRIVTFTLGGRRVAVVHGGGADISRFIFQSTDQTVFDEEIATLSALGPDCIVGGHAGLPFTRPTSGALWVNAGVIGMPTNDGTPRTWFATMTVEANGVQVAFHALSYDYAAAAESLCAAGLPNDYAETLASGLWPSLDVLPQAETAATGAAISPQPIVF